MKYFLWFYSVLTIFRDCSWVIFVFTYIVLPEGGRESLPQNWLELMMKNFARQWAKQKNGVTNWGWGEGLSFKKFDQICYRGFYLLITNTVCKHTWVAMWFPTITIKVHLIGIFTSSKTCRNSHKVPLATNCLVSQSNFGKFFKHPMQVVPGLLTTRGTWYRKPIS